jgi:hypothetical protein
MANEILTKYGTPIVWSDTTDYSATNSGYTRTAQIDLTSIASGAARQGVKVDLGATRARRYLVKLGIEMDVAATAGNLISVHFSESISATAGTGNTGGASGADAAYTGYSGGSLVNSIVQLKPVGVMSAEVVIAATPQYQTVGIISGDDLERYISPVIYNETDQAFEGDAVEMFLALIPLIDEVQ